MPEDVGSLDEVELELLDRLDLKARTFKFFEKASVHSLCY